MQPIIHPFYQKLIAEGHESAVQIYKKKQFYKISLYVWYHLKLNFQIIAAS